MYIEKQAGKWDVKTTPATYNHLLLRYYLDTYTGYIFPAEIFERWGWDPSSS
jgi:hypothetical protein